MPLTFKEARAAVKVRLESAETAAQVVDPGIEMHFARVNKRDFFPDADTNFLRGYSDIANSERLGVTGFERHFFNIFVQIIVELNRGIDLLDDLWEAIEPSFLSNTGDGLSLEDAQPLTIPGDDGTNFVGLATCPGFFYLLKPLNS